MSAYCLDCGVRTVKDSAGTLVLHHLPECPSKRGECPHCGENMRGGSDCPYCGSDLTAELDDNDNRWPDGRWASS